MQLLFNFKNSNYFFKKCIFIFKNIKFKLQIIIYKILI